MAASQEQWSGERVSERAVVSEVAVGGRGSVSIAPLKFPPHAATGERGARRVLYLYHAPSCMYLCLGLFHLSIYRFVRSVCFSLCSFLLIFV